MLYVPPRVILLNSVLNISAFVPLSTQSHLLYNFLRTIFAVHCLVVLKFELMGEENHSYFPELLLQLVHRRHIPQ